MFVDDVLEMGKREIRNAVIQPLAADPSNPLEGQIYYNTVTKKKRTFNGTTWDEEGTSAAAVTQTANSGAAGRMKVSGAADKTISDYAGGAGLVKSDAAGVVSPAASGTDYLTGNSTNTLTNKTLDAAGAGNSLTNVGTANFAANVVDIDTTLAAGSDTRLPTQKAVKTYIDQKVNSIGIPRGGLDCSANPNYPAAINGDYYRVTAAGLIGGASGTAVQIGDVIECFVTSVAGTQAAVGANWTIVQANVDQATSATLGLVQMATQAETEAKAVANKAVTPAALAKFGVVQEFVFGNGAATSFAIAHNRNSKAVVCQVRDAATDEVRYPKIVSTDANTVTISGYIAAPGVNSMKAVIIG